MSEIKAGALFCRDLDQIGRTTYDFNYGVVFGEIAKALGAEHMLKEKEPVRILVEKLTSVKADLAANEGHYKSNLAHARQYKKHVDVAKLRIVDLEAALKKLGYKAPKPSVSGVTEYRPIR
jgi:hypothetical protein